MYVNSNVNVCIYIWKKKNSNLILNNNLQQWVTNYSLIIIIMTEKHGHHGV